MVNIVAGIDIGNGYVKAAAKAADLEKAAETINMPSAASVITNSADLRVRDEAAIASEFDDFCNKLAVRIESHMVSKYSGLRMYIGRRAVLFGKAIYEFNLKEGKRSKSEKELSAVLALSVIAGKALKSYYMANGHLPPAGEPLEAEACMATSLPINEFKDRRDAVMRDYMRGVHKVEILNFEESVTVEIRVAECVVLAEGASAQLAISAKNLRGPEFMASVVSGMAACGMDLPDGIGPEELKLVSSAIGVDIGEGTVNFPVYNKSAFNTDVSTTFNKGYGHVIDEAVARLSQMGRPFANRKKLIEWLIDTESMPLKRRQREEAIGVVRTEVEVFTDELVLQFSDVLDRSGAFAEAIYVYGGGACGICVREILYPKLKDAVARMFDDMPILYMPEDVCRDLNRNGLYIGAAHRDPNCINQLPQASIKG